MNMKKLTTLLLTATLGLASGAALAADTGAQSNNGQANSSADAGQVAPYPPLCGSRTKEAKRLYQ